MFLVFWQQGAPSSPISSVLTDWGYSGKGVLALGKKLGFSSACYRSCPRLPFVLSNVCISPNLSIKIHADEPSLLKEYVGSTVL